MPNSPRIRPNVVLDASTVVSAALKSDSIPARAVVLARRYDIVALSIPVLLEIEDVIGRSKFDRYVPPEDRAKVLSEMREGAMFVVPTDAVQDCRDPGDNKYLGPALAAKAEVIVSGDKDLLALHPWRGVQILSPADYLLHLEQRLARSF